MERDYTLYQHFCKVTKKSYIGITKQKPQNRWKSYGKGYRPNTHFGRAINKYGWDNFEHIILATNLTEEEAKQLEQTCIVVFETYGKDGYNSTFGGDGTLGISEEAKKRRFEKFKGHIVTEETRQKISNANKGRKLSEETKQKMSKARKGKRNIGCLKRIAQYTVDGNLVNIYKSATDLEMENKKYNRNCISKCCLGYSKTYKGYVWRYIDE